MVDDIIRWNELKEVIELEIAGDPRTIELYIKRLLKWKFLTETRRNLYRINQQDTNGHPIAADRQLKSTREALENALKINDSPLQHKKEDSQLAEGYSDNTESPNN